MYRERKGKAVPPKRRLVCAAVAAVVLAVLVSACGIVGQAELAPQGPTFVFDVYEDHAELMCYLGTDSEVTIPAEYEGLPVTVIGTQAFVGAGELRSVVIPDGVTTICERTFYKCEKLEQVTFPASVREIRWESFAGTPWLANQTDEFVIVNHVLIAYNGPGGDVVVPDGVKRIDGAFAENKDITSVTLPDSVTAIGECAFYSTFLKEIQLPPHLEYIGAMAFSYTWIDSFDFPDTLTAIEGNAFYRNSWLENQTDEFVIVNGNLLDYNGTDPVMRIPDGVVRISTPSYKMNITEVIMSDSVQWVSCDAFFVWSNLERVSFSANLKCIGYRAFYQCENLKELEFPEGLEFIDGRAFAFCHALTRISLPDSVIVLGSMAFVGCDALREVHLSNNLRNIPRNCFCQCYALETVTGGARVEFVGADAFYHYKAKYFPDFPADVYFAPDSV